MDIFSKNWTYFISRNVSIWHDELTIRAGLDGSYATYRLPNIMFSRIHRFNHADFYFLSEGQNSKKNFYKHLSKQLEDYSYARFLQKKYYQNGGSLIKTAKNLKSSATSLQRFFDQYGACTAMLDITAVASKIITDKLFAELGTYSDRENIIAYYGSAKKLSPLQRFERTMTFSIGKVPKEILIENLYKRYRWIPINFVGEPWTKQDITKRINTYKPLHHKALVRPLVKLPLTIWQQLHMLRVITELNEFRKEIFTKAIFYTRPAFDELAKNNKFNSWRDINYLTTPEIIDLIKGKNIYQKKLLPTRSLVLLVPGDKKHVVLVYGKDVGRFEKKFRIIKQGVLEFKGTVAQKGVVQGKVKIIKEANDFGKFKRGDILVAKMTSVDFVPIMKKAAAFITDEGGLACHAAVIAREYHTPCIVGTGFASHILKDGDLVEVDAINGIVRKLK